MKREIFTEEHDAFRDMVRAFIAKEITPYHDQWVRHEVAWSEWNSQKEDRLMLVT